MSIHVPFVLGGGYQNVTNTTHQQDEDREEGIWLVDAN